MVNLYLELEKPKIISSYESISTPQQVTKLMALTRGYACIALGSISFHYQTHLSEWFLGVVLLKHDSEGITRWRVTNLTDGLSSGRPVNTDLLV